MAKGGFGKDPVKGDGYSRRKASEILKDDRRFKGLAPEVVAAETKREDLNRWVVDQKNHEIPVTTDGLLQSLAGTPLQEDITTHPKTGHKVRRFIRGNWSLGFVDYGRGALDFSISVHVQDRFMISASIIRQRIVSQLGEDVYEQWKRMVRQDEESLGVCFEAGCEWLKKKNRIGCSYISSPSSLRLVERFGLRTERGWCFLFPHYVGTF
jgi:hypothetical protein